MKKDNRGRVATILCRDGLTPMQREFVEHYTNKEKDTYLNATKAAKVAYPNAGNSAYQLGHENLRKPRVEKAIKEALKEDRDNPKLTIKQRKFLKSYVANGGNGTQAALAAYDVKDSKSAAVLSTHALRNSNVRKELEVMIEDSGLSREEIVRELKKDIYFSNEPNPVRTRSLELLTKHVEISTSKSGDRPIPTPAERDELYERIYGFVRAQMNLIEEMPEEQRSKGLHIFRNQIFPLMKRVIRDDVLFKDL